MTGIAVLLAVAASVLSATGMLCFKLYMQRGGVLSPRRLLTNGWNLLGLLMYGGYFAALILAYDVGGAMSLVFPLTSVAYLIALLLGRLVLEERFGRRVVVGALLIVAGCALLGLGSDPGAANM